MGFGVNILRRASEGSSWAWMPFCLRSLCRAWETTDLPLTDKPVTQTHQPFMKNILRTTVDNHFRSRCCSARCNSIRPHQGLKGKTPAEACGITVKGKKQAQDASPKRKFICLKRFWTSAALSSCLCSIQVFDRDV